MRVSGVPERHGFRQDAAHARAHLAVPTLPRPSRVGRLNNVVLLTPNEQMSAQHERDLRASGLHARLFSGDAARRTYFSRSRSST